MYIKAMASAPIAGSVLGVCNNNKETLSMSRQKCHRILSSAAMESRTVAPACYFAGLRLTEQNLRSCLYCECQRMYQSLWRENTQRNLKCQPARIMYSNLLTVIL
jgi:hypothetical protein